LSSCVFADRIARIAETIDGVDAMEVFEGIHLDRRLRNPPAVSIAQYLLPGPGFGGSCLPKDLAALATFAGARRQDASIKGMSILDAALGINQTQPFWFVERIDRALGGLADRGVLVLGLAFKPGTDDLRDSVALPLCRELAARGAAVGRTTAGGATAAHAADSSGVTGAGRAFRTPSTPPRRWCSSPRGRLPGDPPGCSPAIGAFAVRGCAWDFRAVKCAPSVTISRRVPGAGGADDGPPSQARSPRRDHGTRRELYALDHAAQPFVPGETYVAYAGRVFDGSEIEALVASALDAWITAGPYAVQFERALASYAGARGAVFVNSGSSANLLALAACTSPKIERRLQPGDEVITPAAAFPTTVNPIVQVGCVPVFVDVELGTYNPDPERIERAIGPRTRAIMVAHAVGNPFDAKAYKALADRHGLFLIEDTCDGLGGSLDGKMLGSFGDFGTLSFYPAHQMTTGEGGAVLCNDPARQKLVESFRDWGKDCWCEPGKDNTCGKRFGWQLGRLPEGYDQTSQPRGLPQRRRPTASGRGARAAPPPPSFVTRAAVRLGLLQTLEPLDVLILPRSDARAEPCWYAFPITVRPEAPFTKNDFVAFLEGRRIATRSLFGGNLLRQPAWDGAQYRIAGSLTNSDTIMTSTFLVGVYPGIDEERLHYMRQTLQAFLTR
jgi:CDP-6-deoxy-D-xylo-4-hexulose-3-dehydrase